MAEHVIDRAIAGVADRAPVDWQALEQEAGSDENRGMLECLRILGGLADLHHALAPEDDPSQEETASTAHFQSVGASRELQTWGRYRLVEKVGEGGFGSVYRAWDPALELEVAIKILHKRVADARLKEALLREGRALAKVRDPHVVRVLGVETNEDQIALCMEFVHGETLEDSLRRHGTLSAREAALVGEDVCRALAAVHLAGFVHRDVKARNVMRETAGRIVLMDFGAGQKTDDLKVPGQVRAIGTPPYMAPELLAGQSATVCSDVYSVGVLLYRLVTGEYPIDGHTPDELRAAHMQGQRRLLSERRPNLPAGFIQVVDRALAADPAKRFSSAGALLDALRTVGATERKARVMMWAPAAVLIAVATIVFLGFLTSAAFNLTVGRVAPFDYDPPRVWLEMGLRSLVAPIFYMGAMLLLAWSARFAVNVLGLHRPARRVLDAARRRFAVGTGALDLSDPGVFAQAVVAFGLFALALIVWQFSDVLAACTTVSLTNAPVEQLLALSPGHTGAFYRIELDALTLIFIVALIRIRAMRAAHSKGVAAAIAPIAVLLALTVLMSETPYRLLWRNKAERVEVAGNRCYVLGEQPGQALVYCPDKQPPRNDVVSLTDGTVRRTQIVESIFTAPDVSRQ